MKKIRIRQNIEVHEDCVVLNPRRSGMGIDCDFKASSGDPLERFDEVTEVVKSNVAEQLAEARQEVQHFMEEEKEQYQKLKRQVKNED